MKHILFLLFLLFGGTMTVSSQVNDSTSVASSTMVNSARVDTTKQKAKITILHSDIAKIAVVDTMPNRLIGNVHLKHDNMFLTCDSLFQYSNRNYIEAFGQVHVVQNDTLNLWGDYLNYDGDTRLCKVRNNVTMNDLKITLTTDSLDYDANTGIGYYTTGGTIKDSVNTLRSRYAYLYTSINEIYFHDSVRVIAPDYTMYSDTMKYGTVSKLISIVGPTTIVGDNRTLYSEDGWYNSITSHSELYKNNRITYNTYIGAADTIIVDSITNTAIMKRNLYLHDTINDMIIEGDYGEVLKNNDYAYVTKKALLTIAGEQDSLYIHGDTLSVIKDTAQNDILRCYFNTKFFNNDIQGKCDSMLFPVADSTIYLYNEPVIWANENQMTAEIITMHTKNNEVDQFQLINKAMVINSPDTMHYKLVDSTMFNQIKGRTITGYVSHNELYMVYVDGSGEAIYYTDDKGYIFGMANIKCSSMRLEFTKQMVDTITFITKPEGTLNPVFMLSEQDKRLSDFQWLKWMQPRKKEDIFVPYPKKDTTKSSESDENKPTTPSESRERGRRENLPIAPRRQNR